MRFAQIFYIDVQIYSNISFLLPSQNHHVKDAKDQPMNPTKVATCNIVNFQSSYIPKLAGQAENFLFYGLHWLTSILCKTYDSENPPFLLANPQCVFGNQLPCRP